MVKGEIVGIIKCFNNVNCKFYYEIQIEVEEKPNLKAGECEINQK